MGVVCLLFPCKRKVYQSVDLHMEMYLYFDYSQTYFAEESSSPSYIQLFESMQLKSWINIENLHGPNNYMSAFNCDLNKDKISCVKTNKK